MRSRSNTVTTTGPGAGLASSLPIMRERRLQARHADREAGRRHRLAAEARHQPVIAPAAADRAEAHRAAFLVLGLEQSVQPRRPGRCSTRGRGRRRDRCERDRRIAGDCVTSFGNLASSSSMPRCCARLARLRDDSPSVRRHRRIAVDAMTQMRSSAYRVSPAPLVKSPLSSLRPSPSSSSDAFDRRAGRACRSRAAR